MITNLKLLEVEDLKMRAAGLEKRKGKKGDVGDLKFVEGETLDGRRAFLVSRESNSASLVLVQIVWWVNICKIWQKVGESPDVFPIPVDVGVVVNPSEPLEGVGGRKENWEENAGRCILEPSIA